MIICCEELLNVANHELDELVSPADFPHKSEWNHCWWVYACYFSYLVCISNFNINTCTFQSSSESFVPFHIVFSCWIKYLSAIVWLYKHMLYMSRSKIKDIIFTSSAIIWLITVHIYDQKRSLNSFKFFSCLTFWQRQKLLEGKMI